MTEMKPLLFKRQSFTFEPLTVAIVRATRNIEAGRSLHGLSCSFTKSLHLHCMDQSCKKLIEQGDKVLCIFDGVFQSRRKLRLTFCSTGCQRRHYVMIQVRQERTRKEARHLKRQAVKKEKELLLEGNVAGALSVNIRWAIGKSETAAQERYRKVLRRELSRAQRSGDLTRFRVVKKALSQLNTITWRDL